MTTYNNFFGGAFFSGGFFGPGVDSSDTHDGGYNLHKHSSEAERKLRDAHREVREHRRADIESAWKAVMRHAEPAVVQEAIEIAKPAIKVSAKRASAMTLPGAKVPTPNFDILSQFRIHQLMKLHEELLEEEEIMLFMDN